MREIWADNAKFLGITLMVMGHNSLANESLLDFIYSFHMPLFFILSGYFASVKEQDLTSIIKKNIKGLLVPYWVFALVNLPFTYYILWSHYTSFCSDDLMLFLLKPLLGILLVDNTDYSYFIGPFWFFAILFQVRLLFSIICKKTSDLKALLFYLLVSIGLYLLLSSSTVYVPFRFKSVLLVFPFYVAGFIIKHYTKMIQHIVKWHVVKSLCCALIGLLVTFVLSTINGHVEISGAGSGNFLPMMYLIAFIGSFSIIMIAAKMLNYKYILTIGGVLRLF